MSALAGGDRAEGVVLTVNARRTEQAQEGEAPSDAGSLGGGWHTDVHASRALNKQRRFNVFEGFESDMLTLPGDLEGGTNEQDRRRADGRSLVNFAGQVSEPSRTQAPVTREFYRTQ